MSRTGDMNYLVNSIKKQKGKPCEMDLPLMKSDIIRFFLGIIRVF